MNYLNTPVSRAYVLDANASPRLHSYLDVIVEKADGQLFIGHVVTPLDLNDWAELHHFKIRRFEKKAPAQAGERTTLAPKSRMPGIFKTSRTIVGIPAPGNHAAFAPTPIAGTVIKML